MEILDISSALVLLVVLQALTIMPPRIYPRMASICLALTNIIFLLMIVSISLIVIHVL